MIADLFLLVTITLALLIASPALTELVFKKFNKSEPNKESNDEPD